MIMRQIQQKDPGEVQSQLPTVVVYPLTHLYCPFSCLNSFSHFPQFCFLRLPVYKLPALDSLSQGLLWGGIQTEKTPPLIPTTENTILHVIRLQEVLVVVLGNLPSDNFRHSMESFRRRFTMGAHELEKIK